MKKTILTICLLLCGCVTLKNEIKTLKTEQEVLNTVNANLQKEKDSLLLRKHYLCAWILELMYRSPYLGKYEFFVLNEVQTYKELDEQCEEAIVKYMEDVPERKKLILESQKESSVKPLLNGIEINVQ